IDLFLDRSGIDPDVQYQHHLRCLELLDETEEFRYIVCDLEFEKCAEEQNDRLTRILFGEKTPSDNLSPEEFIQCILDAWGRASTSRDKMEVFVALYHEVINKRETRYHNAIRASLYMRSSKRLENIINRVNGSTDPEVFLQAVADEL